jgi:hypothetical protein
VSAALASIFREKSISTSYNLCPCGERLATKGKDRSVIMRATETGKLEQLMQGSINAGIP